MCLRFQTLSNKLQTDIFTIFECMGMRVFFLRGGGIGPSSVCYNQGSVVVDVDVCVGMYVYAYAYAYVYVYVCLYVYVYCMCVCVCE